MRTGLRRPILLPVAVLTITTITSELVQIQQTTEFVSQGREFSLLRSEWLREILPVLTVEVNQLVDARRRSHAPAGRRT